MAIVRPALRRGRGAAGGLTPGGVQESDEIYLLSGAGDNVKIRDALMDIKVLREVDADGLEQWTPVMKAGFPLPAAEAAKVLAALGLPVPTPSRASYTLDEFLAQFAAPGARGPRGEGPQAARALHGRRLHGRALRGGGERQAHPHPRGRVGGRGGGDAGGARPRPGRLHEHQLSARPGGPASTTSRSATPSIDAGTNSIKFHIGERAAGGTWRTVVDRAEVTRLGEGLAQQGAIIDAALERTAAAIAGMVDEAKRHGVRAIAAVGTAGLRIASNGSRGRRRDPGAHRRAHRGDLGRRGGQAGLRGRQGRARARPRARWSSSTPAAAARSSPSGTTPSVDERFSVDVGAVRYTERFGLDGAVSPEVLREAMAAIAADLARIDGRPAPDALVAMGGAVTNITAVRHGLATYDPAVVQGSVLDRAEIDRQIELYRSRDADARRAIVGLQPKRAEVILAGACIVRTVMEKLGKAELHGQRPRPAPRRAGRAVRKPEGGAAPGERRCRRCRTS